MSSVKDLIKTTPNDKKNYPATNQSHHCWYVSSRAAIRHGTPWRLLARTLIALFLFLSPLIPPSSYAGNGTTSMSCASRRTRATKTRVPSSSSLRGASATTILLTSGRSSARRGPFSEFKNMSQKLIIIRTKRRGVEYALV